MGGPALPGHELIVLDIEFSPDGRWLATASGDPLLFTDDTVRLWDLQNLTQKTIVLRHTSDVNMLNFSPDGIVGLRRSAQTIERGLWSLFDVTKPPIILSQYEQGVSALTFSADSRSFLQLSEVMGIEKCDDGPSRTPEEPPAVLDSGKVDIYGQRRPSVATVSGSP